MIITDGTPDSPKAAEARLNMQRSEQAADQLPPPPQYTSQPEATSQTYLTPRPVMVQPQSALKRFFEAFAIAALIWILAGVLTRSIVDLANDTHRHHQNPGKGGPQESDGRVDFCTDSWLLGGPISSTSNIDMPSFNSNMNIPPKSARTSFELPSSSDLLFLVARGDRIYGNVEISDTGRTRDVVRVEVTAYYYDEAAFQRASVCKMERENGQNGVGIFSPLGRNHNSSYLDQIRFEVTVHLPAFPSDGVLHVRDFNVDMPMFAQRLGDLANSVHFRSLSLRSSNAPISVISVEATHAQLQTSNGPIEGSFKSDDYLALITSNAPINAEIGLYNNKDVAKHTQLVMKTSNGPIGSEIGLYSTSGSALGAGSFKVGATTSNNHVDINYSTSPVDSILDCAVKTSNAPVTVSLHPAYEGEYSLRTSNMRPSIDVHEVEDPAGKGRRRSVLQFSYRNSLLHGSVYWDTSKKSAGKVEITSSNSPVSLIL